MGLGKYLSTKSEQDIYHREWNTEILAIRSSYDIKYQQTLERLVSQGVQRDEAKVIIDIMVNYPQVWIKRQMDNEL